MGGPTVLLARAPPTDPRVAKLLERRAQFLSFVERRVGSRELAEEILQEAFVRGLGGAAGVRGDEAVVPWFYRLLRNAIVDAHRRRVAREKGAAALASEAAVLDAGDEEMPRAQICTCVSLPRDGAQAPSTPRPSGLVDLDGGSVAELADRAGIHAERTPPCSPAPGATSPGSRAPARRAGACADGTGVEIAGASGERWPRGTLSRSGGPGADQGERARARARERAWAPGTGTEARAWAPKRMGIIHSFSATGGLRARPP